MGLVGTLFDKVRRVRERSRNKKEFLSRLLDAVRDGELTSTELAQLDDAMVSFGLHEADIHPVRVQAYLSAFNAVTADRRVTAKEMEEMERIQKYLGLDDSQILSTKKDLARLRLLDEVHDGVLPEIESDHIVLQRSEKAHWAEPADLLEERVVRRRYEGGSQGVSIRVAKGLSFRVGAHRGHIVTDTAVLPVSAGHLLITNKRVVFRGDKKSFNIRHDKLLGLERYSDGLAVTDDKGKVRTVRYPDPANSQLVAAILEAAIAGATK